MIKLGKTKRVKQPWQAYHKMTYESKWKPEIDKQWEEYTKMWKQEHPGEPVAKTRFAFMNDFMREKYDMETPEMKQKVEEYRHEAKNNESTDTNKMYQRSVVALSHKGGNLRSESAILNCCPGPSRR